MSVKRQATTELNHENWDQEDPKEEEDEAGAFKIASKDILEKRVIKTAKRRSQISGEEVKKSVFSGFSGFNKTQPSSFDFLSNLTNGKSNSTSTPKSDIAMTFGTSNTKLGASNSSLFSSTGTTSKLTTEALKESPLFSGAVGKIGSGQSVFNNSSQDSKSDNPFNNQTTSAFASFSSKPSENSTTSQVASNIFGANPAAKITTSPFSITTITSTNTITSTTSSLTSFKTGSTLVNQTSSSSSTLVQSKGDTENEKKESEDPKSRYYSKLKGLNVCVSDWIKQHVDKTPLCILSPIFKDYEKYLSEIQDEYESSKEQSSQEEVAKPTTATTITDTTATKTSSFTNNTKSIFSSNTANTFSAGDKPSNFSFGITPTTSTSNPLTNNAGIFGLKSPTQGMNSILAPSGTPSNGSSPFSFGVGKPFSFNSNIKQNEEPAKQENEEEDEPPKVEFTPVVEQNSVYDKKCKIFVKKDENFVDKGVGTLYIKKIEESGKHQLLVRANTTLGNVLLNLILSSALPTKRMGKNNVMMVCIPTPDFKPPPVPILIRVKTSEEADDLLSTLEKYKS